MGTNAKRVLLPSPMVDPAGEALLGRVVEVVRGGALDEAERDRVLPTVHGIYGRATAAEIEAATSLEVIGSGGSGVDGIDVGAATEHGVLVVNAAGAQASAVAEHAIGLMLALGKRIAASDRLLRRERRFPDRREYLGDAWPVGAPRELHGRTLGLVGLGEVGRELARACRTAFAMDVLAFDPYVERADAAAAGAELVDGLDDLLAHSHVVSLHVPLTPETRHLLGERELRRMRADAYLVNLARGGVVDDAALVRALREGWIAGAGLDVFDPEPLPADHPLFELENVVLTPHIGGWTAESLPRLACTTANEMLAALRGERPARLVNPQAWPAFVARCSATGAHR